MNRQVIAAKLGGRTQRSARPRRPCSPRARNCAQIETRIARQSVVAPASGFVQDVFFRPGRNGSMRGNPCWRCCRRPTARCASTCRSRNSRDSRSAGGYRFPATIAARPRRAHQLHVEADGVHAAGHLLGTERAKLVYRLDARLPEGAASLPLGLPVSVKLLPMETGEKQR